MKLKYLLIAVLAGATLVGCQRESVVENDDRTIKGETNYMGFTIAMPAPTKADPDPGSFENGKVYENAIKTIHFFFYKNGAYVSWGYGDVAKRFTDANATNPTTGGNVEEIRDGGEDVSNPGIRKGVVVLESTMAIPDQVLCVINSRNAGWYRNKSLEQVKNAIHSGAAETVKPSSDSWQEFQNATATGGPYFVMLTSPMYSNGEVKYATDILVEKDAAGNFTANSYIQSTIAAAEAKPLEVYVERMAARVEIDNLKAKTAGGILNVDGYIDAENLDAAMKDASNEPIWDIEPVAWALTAHNKKAYNIKRIDTAWWGDATYTGWLESGTQVPNPLKPSENMYTRINWCIDPNYSASDFTFTNRQVYPHSARQYYTQNEEKYWTATEIKAHNDGTEASLEDILRRYCYENTFDAAGQKNNPRLNGTMLLFYARAKKHGATDFEDLFAYMGQTYTYKDYVEHLLSTMWAHGSEFYVKEGSDYKPISDPAVQATFVTGSKYLKIVRSTTMNQFFGNDEYGPYEKGVINKTSDNDPSHKIGDLYLDWVIDMGIRGDGTPTLQPKTFDDAFPTINTFTQTDEKGYADGYVTLVPDSNMPTLYVNDPSLPGYSATDPSTQFRAITDAEKVQAFLGHVVEPANMYRKGQMYYAITLKHFGEAVDNPTDKNPLEGNYGVVRNNLYRVSIGKVMSLGHGIDDPDEPIIPGDRKKPFYLAAKINILSWQIAKQTADLQE